MSDPQLNQKFMGRSVCIVRDEYDQEHTITPHKGTAIALARITRAMVRHDLLLARVDQPDPSRFGPWSWDRATA